MGPRLQPVLKCSQTWDIPPLGINSRLIEICSVSSSSYDSSPINPHVSRTSSVKSLEKINIDYATVHLLNGIDALKTANEAAKKINLDLLGVSVLTSFDNEDLSRLGFKEKIED